jgi:hypothetical protein
MHEKLLSELFGFLKHIISKDSEKNHLDRMIQPGVASYIVTVLCLELLAAITNFAYYFGEKLMLKAVIVTGTVKVLSKIDVQIKD